MTFERYLRTGRRVGPIETKFNPWHDPDDGRFTFAGRGRHFPGPVRSVDRGRRGFSGEGGSFGGGGASGTWEPGLSPQSTQAARTLGIAASGRAERGFELSAQGTRTSTPARVDVTPPKRAKNPRERLTVRKNGYEFSIDPHARTRRISGEIRLQRQSRSKRAQSDAGKPDRRDSDDGGHFIAARFNGPREWFNHFAQDANFNRGAYRGLEERWARAVHSGRRVFVDIVPHYRGTSMRPYKLTIYWDDGGQEYFHQFPNERQSGSRER